MINFKKREGEGDDCFVSEIWNIGPDSGVKDVSETKTLDGIIG
jgi:hypothetical protein